MEEIMKEICLGFELDLYRLDTCLMCERSEPRFVIDGSAADEGCIDLEIQEKPEDPLSKFMRIRRSALLSAG